MSKPRKEISEKDLRNLLRLYPTKKDVAAYFECSEDTIENRCDEYAGVSFKELREQCMVHTRLDLVRKALVRADKSDVLLIFCLKRLCGWEDDLEKANTTITLNYQIPKKEETE